MFLTLMRIWLIPALFGTGITLSLAPFNLWPLSIISVIGLLYCLHSQFSIRHSLYKAFGYATGMYGTGVTWIFVSVNDHSSAPTIVALLTTFGFITLLSLIFTLQISIYARYYKAKKFGLWLGFPALWIAFEWIRSWFLTGFPWLYVGYAHINSPLSGYAPLGGVYFLSFISILTSIIFFRALALDIKYKYLCFSNIFIIWMAGYFLFHVEWTTLSSKRPLVAAAIQGNIPLELKWQPDHAIPSIRTYEKMTSQILPADIILWPETAIPLFQNQAAEHLRHLNEQGSNDYSTIITGIPFWIKDDRNIEARGKYHNSIIALGLGKGVYHKQKLVPFGEYIPFEHLIRKIDLFDFPMSGFQPGASNQTLLQSAYNFNDQINTYSIAPFICYEIMFPELVSHMAKQANIIVTVSNDAWFGRSIGPDQHLQMAQMRALENGKSIIRATNTGTSAIIDQKGRILTQSDLFQAQSITSNIQLFSGNTLYSKLGAWPILILMFICLSLPICMFFNQKKCNVTDLRIK